MVTVQHAATQKPGADKQECTASGHIESGHRHDANHKRHDSGYDLGEGMKVDITLPCIASHKQERCA